MTQKDAVVVTPTAAPLKRIRVLTGYTALARFRAGIPDDSKIIEVPRIPVHTPYAYSPTSLVEFWNGQPVVICETRHIRYEVFDASGLVS